MNIIISTLLFIIYYNSLSSVFVIWFRYSYIRCKMLDKSNAFENNDNEFEWFVESSIFAK